MRLLRNVWIMVLGRGFLLPLGDGWVRLSLVEMTLLLFIDLIDLVQEVCLDLLSKSDFDVNGM